MSQFVGQNVDGTYGNNVDWTKSWTGGINPNGMYTNNVTTTKVLCKDGNFDYESSSPNAKYDNSKTCMNNGGRAEKQPVVVNTEVYAKGKESLLKKISGAYNKNLIIAGVLVAGYFAYKKFKK